MVQSMPTYELHAIVLVSLPQELCCLLTSTSILFLTPSPCIFEDRNTFSVLSSVQMVLDRVRPLRGPSVVPKNSRCDPCTNALKLWKLTSPFPEGSNPTIDRYPRGPVRQGGSADLWDEVARVTAAGADVAQLYVGIPDDDAHRVPARQLRGFEKPYLEPGEGAEVVFPLTRRDLSVWDVVAQKWALGGGEYKVWVGTSSRDLPLEGSLKI